MSGLFRDIAKVALEEIVKKHVKDSKYGFFLAQTSMDSLVDELFEFVETSRRLKSAGDRYLGQGDDLNPKNTSALKSARGS